MKHKYMFTAVMLFVLMAAGIVLTNVYVRMERSSGSSPIGHDHGSSGSQSGEAGAGSSEGHGSEAGTDHRNQTDEKDHEFYVLTSFYPMYIAAKNIIGNCEGVTLQNLSEPRTGCMHDYQLTTEDMRNLSYADAFIVNGGGIENFLADVAKQYPELRIIDACEQVELLEDNAHAWMSIANHMTQVRTITDRLAALDADHAFIYEKNCINYLEKLEALRQKQQEDASSWKAQNILIFHEAFDYIARDYGLTVAGVMDLDEERQISAGEVADVLEQIHEHEAGIILAEELYGRRMCETVQKEADVRVVYLDTCVRGDYEADSYLRAMEENIAQMKAAGAK